MKLVWKVTERGCFEVTSHCRKEKGYVLLRAHGAEVRAHRHIWEECFGPIPEGMLVCHKCDNPPCVNPEHLFLGTPADNSRDMAAKGRGVVPRLRGEQHPKAKLTDAIVKQIHRQYVPKRRGHGTYALAKKFGVSQGAVHNVVAGFTWGHVAWK